MKKVLFAAFLASIVFAGCKKAEMAPAPETAAPAATAPAVMNSTDAVTTPAAAPAAPAATPETK